MNIDITKINIGEISQVIKRGISSYYLCEEGNIENFVNIKDIQNGVINMEFVERVKIKITNSTKNSQLEVGDLVLAVKGSNYKCGLVDENSEGSYISSNLIAIKLKHQYNSELVLEYLNSSFGQKELNIRASGNFQKSLSIKSILDIEIPIFPKDKENVLVKFFELSKKLVKLNMQELKLRSKLNNEIIGEVLKND